MADVLHISFLATACGLVTAVAWGVADYWSAKAARIAGPVSGVIAVNTIGLIAFALFYALSQTPHVVTAAGVWYAIAAGVAIAIGQMMFFVGLHAGPVSLVSPIASSYPLITTIGLLLFFNARLSDLELLGIAAVMLGVMAASGLFTLAKNQRRLGRGPTFALLAALGWGVGYVFIAQALTRLDWQTESVIQLVVIGIVTLLAVPLVKGNEQVDVLRAFGLMRRPLVIGAGLVLMLGIVVLNAGISLDPNLTPAITAVSACYPVLTIFLALRNFKEEMRLIPLGGAVLSVAGVVLLSLR